MKVLFCACQSEGQRPEKLILNQAISLECPVWLCVGRQQVHDENTWCSAATARWSCVTGLQRPELVATWLLLTSDVILPQKWRCSLPAFTAKTDSAICINSRRFVVAWAKWGWGVCCCFWTLFGFIMPEREVEWNTGSGSWILIGTWTGPSDPCVEGSSHLRCWKLLPFNCFP